ncbi:hypothetical protein CP557_17980 [Natrinema ejinorense]|uniref:Uncharacterized protein n=1 Tax=Natrinema ejinorense TaxID=373386 RepID=A0A2A5QZI3_9EURY|nr:hypothetical protein CP557_17980 [Natrinema ejinorense]
MDASELKSLVGWLFDVGRVPRVITATPAIASQTLRLVVTLGRLPLEPPFEALFTGPAKAMGQ